MKLDRNSSAAPGTLLQNQITLKQSRRTDECFKSCDQCLEIANLRLFQRDRDDSRAIERDHIGKPYSSYMSL